MPKWILFLFGILLTTVGFLLSIAEEIPLVMSVSAPRYARAVHGLAQLQTSRVLRREDQGFDELAGLYVDARFNPLGKSEWATGELHADSLLSPKEHALVSGGWRRPIDIYLSNGQKPPRWSIEQAEKSLDSVKSRGLLHYSTILFVLGSLSLVAEFVVERRCSKSG